MRDDAEVGLPNEVPVGVGTSDGTQVFVLADDPADASAPAVVLLKMPPGYRLFRHAHICHRFEVVVKGTLEVSGKTPRRT